jgi:hypothetical protein
MRQAKSTCGIADALANAACWYRTFITETFIVHYTLAPTARMRRLAAE